ncbi:MAG: hypothetical protein LUG91_09245 [Ruminococcus sp.]|nr:hypothetical protein [Ruminococcus sp.]
MKEDDIVRKEAGGYLGRELTDEEWKDAYPDAKARLDWIISQEGDADGERRKPCYLGKLVQEIVVQNAFNIYYRTMPV